MRSRWSSGNVATTDAGSPAEAIRLRAARRYVVRRGEVVAESPPAHARLSLEGRPGSVNFRLGR